MRVLGVLAGDRLSLDHLSKWVATADIVIAADGGANSLLKIKKQPDVIIGDMDSVSSKAKAFAKEVVQIEEQDSSDCDKLLAYATSRGFNQITLVGLEGTRIDHMIGSLLSCARSKLTITLAYEGQIGTVLRGPGNYIFDCLGNCSLLPLEICDAVWFTGVEWELKGVTLSAHKRVSLSNNARGAVQIQMGSGSAAFFYHGNGAVRWPDFDE